MNSYDLIIIGAGWAGFNAAIRATQLGLKVVLIDKDRLGGTCLNYGCIPTKSLLQSSKIYSLSKNALKFGIDAANPTFDFKVMQERKNKIIEQLRLGMQYTLKKTNLTFLNAQATIDSNEEVLVGEELIKGRYILIATGSRPMELSKIKFDGKKILSSTDILNLDKVPQSVLIIGGGVIGCEFASLFNVLGSKVSIVELMSQLLPQEDREISKKLETIFKKRKIQVNTNTDAKDIDLNNYETVLVCVGRVPNTRALGLDEVGVALEKEKVLVDDYLKTNISNIYAAGDCTGKIMLAHFASYQGRLAADNIVHPDSPQRFLCDSIPNSIFTYPEIGSVGLTEEETKAQGLEVKINKFDFLGSGMAHILDETEGFVKIISDKNTQYILGASIIGPGAVELIGILALAIQTGLKVPQVHSAIFAHPTLSECITETLKN